MEKTAKNKKTWVSQIDFILKYFSWLTVFADKDNYQRLRRVDFAPVETTAVRLVAESAHGESKAHIFSFEVK